MLWFFVAFVTLVVLSCSGDAQEPPAIPAPTGVGASMSGYPPPSGTGSTPTRP